jgi:hypothetical protein
MVPHRLVGWRGLYAVGPGCGWTGQTAREHGGNLAKVFQPEKGKAATALDRPPLVNRSEDFLAGSALRASFAIKL